MLTAVFVEVLDGAVLATERAIAATHTTGTIHKCFGNARGVEGPVAVMRVEEPVRFIDGDMKDRAGCLVHNE